MAIPSIVEQQNVCKYAFFMAKWKHNIYKKFVRELQMKENQIKKDNFSQKAPSAES